MKFEEKQMKKRRPRFYHAYFRVRKVGKFYLNRRSFVPRCIVSFDRVPMESLELLFLLWPSFVLQTVWNFNVLAKDPG